MIAEEYWQTAGWLTSKYSSALPPTMRHCLTDCIPKVKSGSYAI